MRYSIYAISTAIGLITSGILGSCGKSDGSPTVSYSAERDNIEHRELVSIEEELPMIHGIVSLNMFGDTLLIRDIESTDRLYFAYDVVKERYVGSFGKYGPGPGEIANCGTIGIDHDAGLIYVDDHSKWIIHGFNVAEALADTTYIPFKKGEIAKSYGFARPLYLNDSTIYGAVVGVGPRGVGYYLGRYNLLTGQSELLDTAKTNPHSGLLLLNPEKDELIELSIEFDRIQFFDFQGNLKRTVYGPDYKDYNKRIMYYDSPVIVDDKIYVTYVNGDFKDPDVGHQIVVMDLEGNYIKSIDVGVRIEDLTYSPATRRIYVATWDEPQFGYFEIDD